MEIISVIFSLTPPKKGKRNQDVIEVQSLVWKVFIVLTINQEL